MVIRRAEDRDIPGILDLLMQVLNIHAAGRPDLFIPDTTKYSEAELREIFRDDSKAVFVAEEDSRVAGYAFTELRGRQHSENMTDIRTLFVDDLCVDEALRGKRIGHRLFGYLKEYAREKGIYHITLNVWSFNAPAAAFYEKEGMKPMETVMELIL